MASQKDGERRIDIPPVPTDQTSSSSSNELEFSRRFVVSLLFSLNVIQIVGSLGGLWVSIAHEPPASKIIAWLVGYASGCAVMLSFLCFHYRNAGTLNLRQHKAMLVFWLTMSCFFLAWCFFGLACFSGASSFSSDDAPLLKGLLMAILWGSCALYALPVLFLVLFLASICLFLPCLIWARRFSPKEKPRETSTPDSPNAPPTYKFKSKENGGRSGDEGEVLLPAATKRSALYLEKDMVCSICLKKYADNDEMGELTCCSHYIHVECMDKWLKIDARYPFCQSELGGAGGSAT